MKRKTLLICLIILFFSSPSLWAIQNTGAYTIPLEGQHKSAIICANLLVEEGIPVYRIDEETNLFKQGDYLVVIPKDRMNIIDDIAVACFKRIARRLNLNICQVPPSTCILALPLSDTNLGVYFGKGTSGGALWHVNPAEEYMFDVDLVIEEDILIGSHFNYNAISFGSGGFYSYYLGEVGNNQIVDFVEEGNGFIGTCGGSVYGVDLGLLDLEYDTEGGWSAGADLRGPIILSNEAQTHPVMYTIGDQYTPLYWIGQNFINIGDSVTVLSRYVSATPELMPYDPAISRAYGYYPNTEIIERFWGRAAAVSGSYGDGRVVLIGAHPEANPATEIFFINALQYLNSGETVVVDVNNHPVFDTIRSLPVKGETELNINQILPLIKKTYLFFNKVGEVRSIMEGLEESNEAITNAVGEFLIDFFDDARIRAFNLQVDVLKLEFFYLKLTCLDKILDKIQSEIPGDLYTLAKNRIEAGQSEIVALIDQLSSIDALTGVLNEIEPDMIQHKTDLEALLALKEEEGESPAFFEGVIALYNAEGDTLHIVKMDIAYPILKYSFAVNNCLKTLDFTTLFIQQLLILK